MEKEIRNISMEIRAEGESRNVSGYAAVFDTESLDLGGFTEIIERGAFDDMIEQSDVFAFFNHDNDKVLARSNKGKGSLKLSVDEKGLRYEFDAPDTEVGNELLAFLRSGDIDQSSFAFTVAEDVWQKTADGRYLRCIKKFERLYDVSPVWNAAYGAATSVSCRSFDEFKEKEAAELRAAQEAEEAEKKKQLEEYYTKLREEYKSFLN